MEKRTLCHRLHFDTNDNREIAESFDVEYYLLKTMNYYPDREGTFVEDASMYGVEIRKLQEGILQESSSDYNVSRSEERAKSLIELLANNAVTPDSLEFIMSDNK